MNAAMPFRWLWYLARVVFCAAYAMVAFFSKPGARYILVALLAAAAWAFFPWGQAALDHAVLLLAGNAQPETLLLVLLLALSLLWLASLALSVPGALPLLLVLLLMWGACLHDGIRGSLMAASARNGHATLYALLMAVLLLNLLVVLWAVSKVLALVLGTFPPPAWPLRPRAALKAKNRVIAPSPVTLAVPRLRASAPRPPHELHAALPPEVAALLTPRHPPALP